MERTHNRWLYVFARIFETNDRFSMKFGTGCLYIMLSGEINFEVYRYSQNLLNIQKMYTYRNISCYSYLKHFIASIPVYLELTDRGHLQSTPLEQLCT